MLILTNKVNKKLNKTSDISNQNLNAIIHRIKYKIQIRDIEDYGFTTKFTLDLIEVHTDFISASWTMNVLSTGTYDIVAQGDVPPEADPGVTEVKEIHDLLMQMENENRRFAFLLCFLNLLQEA